VTECCRRARQTKCQFPSQTLTLLTDRVATGIDYLRCNRKGRIWDGGSREGSGSRYPRRRRHLRGVAAEEAVAEWLPGRGMRRAAGRDA